MRWPSALSLLVLMTLLPLGCGQASSPPAGPAPAAPDPAASGVNEATEILKGINESIKSEGPREVGVNYGVTQVGTHRVKTVVDAPVSSTISDERAVVTLGARKLTIDFAAGQVILDDSRKANMPAGTKEVEIRFVGGELSLKADGTAVTIPVESRPAESAALKAPAG
jgi:hypothetical protein